MIGCTGTTRVIGAGKISKKKFGVFGPQTIQFSEEEDSNNPALLLDDERTGQSYRVESRLPKVPSKQEAPIFGLKSHKNFIKLNAVEAILNGMEL